MKEKDIRDRIARFLQRTARTAVVPVSVGLGLSAAGCDQHSLHGKAADAGPDLVAQMPDVATNPPDLGDAGTADDLIGVYPPYLSDAFFPKEDLPLIAVPYLVVLVEDAADGAPDTLEAQGVDADRDTFAPPADVNADLLMPPPPPPYLILPQLTGEPLGNAQGIPPDPLTPPEKK